MNQENQTASIGKIRNFLSKPSTRVVVSGLAQLVVVGLTAFAGYKVGKKAGVKTGQVQGYGTALNDLGITHSDVSNVAAAWRESQGVMDGVTTTPAQVLVSA